VRNNTVTRERPATHALVSRVLPGVAVAAVIMAYCAARYGDAVGTFFFVDDFWLMRDAADIDRGSGWPFVEVFRPTNAGFLLYRPLSAAGYFYVLRQLFGVDASAYHAAHLVLFALNACLVAAIVRSLTASWGWALAGGLFYAAAPGHTLAVYHVAVSVMNVPATVVFLMLLWWLRAPERWRAPGAALLQVVALLCGEHAVVTPLLLAWLIPFGPPRASVKARVRSVLPVAAVTALYVAAKLGYFLHHGWPSGGYAMTADPATWLGNLGRFAVVTANLPALRITNATTRLAVGIAVAAALPALILLAYRRGGAWTLAATGLGFFVTALLPVLALADHFYGYHIGIAALGIVLAGIGVCRTFPRRGGVLATAILLLVLAVDRATCDRAGRNDPVAQLVLNAQAVGRELLRDLDETARSVAAGTTITVPDSPLCQWAIAFGGADRVFFDPPIRAQCGDAPPLPGYAAPVPLMRAGRDVPTPGTDPAWDWLRRGAAAVHAVYAGDCRPTGSDPPAK
jgi:hypothetical protein